MPAWALVMQHVGNDFFAGAALACDHHRAVAAAHDLDEVEDRSHARTVADDNLVGAKLCRCSHDRFTVSNEGLDNL